jgi:acetyl esterase/lipase
MYIVSAEKDYFRDDGVVFDMVLKEQGVKSKTNYYPWLATLLSYVSAVGSCA